MKCIIVDDEPLAIEVIESHVAKLDNLEVVATCTNALKAFEVLQKESVDLMFLDIQMPKLTGIDFLKTLQNPPKIIFTTAYREYAIESYDYNAVDYLLKPISFDRFLKAIGKAYGQQIQPLETPTHVQPSDNGDYIYVKSDKKMVKIKLAEVRYIEGLKDYVKIRLADKTIITHQKMSYLEEKLPGDKFLRIHRSYIISVDYVDSFCTTHLDIESHEIPIGRHYKNEVLERLQEGHEL